MSGPEVLIKGVCGVSVRYIASKSIRFAPYKRTRKMTS